MARAVPVLLRQVVVALLLLAAGPAAAQNRVAPDTPELRQALGGDGPRGYALALEPRSFEFPRDHGPHPEFRNEWWYFTGLLRTPAGRRFGFELTIFRIALSPEPRDQGWRSNQLYMAHFALTDVAGRRFRPFQRFARGALGLAGATAQPFAVWLEDWRVAGTEAWTLRAAEQGVALELVLRAARAPLLQGEQGLSRKSATPGNASYYYSIPRLAASGTLRLDGVEHRVEGQVWLDREWSTSALGADQVGWDWFALRLDDGSDLMYYQLRMPDGQAHPFSAGTWSLADGRRLQLGRDGVRLAPLRHWVSKDGRRYPVAWRLSLPAQDLELEITPLLEDQWLDFVVPYWEGAVEVRGRHAGRPLGGEGYLELTGY